MIINKYLQIIIEINIALVLCNSDIDTGNTDEKKFPSTNSHCNINDLMKIRTCGYHCFLSLVLLISFSPSYSDMNFNFMVIS